MKEHLKKILACPNCKSFNLVIAKNSIKCSKCKKEYNINSGVPIFIDQVLADESIAEESFRGKLAKDNPKLFKKIKRVLSILHPPQSSYQKSYKSGPLQIDLPLKGVIRKDDVVLNIGSSSKKAYPNSINIDIGLFENVDIVADGKCLPIKDNSIDVILIESVLEHVDEPEKIIRESYRVLKKGGKVYITMPFIFAYHGSPDDFNRYTLNGLKRRLELSGFEILDFGALSGPFSALNQILRYGLALIFSFNNKLLFSLFLNIIGWLTFWIKYFDIILVKFKTAHIISAINYATGVKK